LRRRETRKWFNVVYDSHLFEGFVLHSAASYTYLLARLEVLPDTSEAKQAAIDAVVAALRLQIGSDINKLLGSARLEAVRDHALYSLLQIVARGDLKDYKEWESRNKNILIASGLDASAIESKMRFLTLVTLASDYIGKELTYAQITSALHVPESDVELWVINAIRSNLLAGKLSQLTQTLHVTRSMTRVFQKAEWKVLEDRLGAWKTNLVGALEVVENARKLAQPAPSVPPVHGDLAKEVPSVST